MPNTTNYSFPTPADTDLVKNGADAIRDLGDAVDTAMNTALGTKKAGMVLLNTTSFSGVATQSINDVFSATYDNYVILTNFTSSSNADLQFRFRVSGADDTNNNYNSAASGYDTNPTLHTMVGNTTSVFKFAKCTATVPTAFQLNFSDPFKSARTNVGFFGLGTNASGAYGNWTGGGAFNTTTSFTGITFYASAGNITGSVSVFGVAK